jgi:hypothetical protein
MSEATSFSQCSFHRSKYEQVSLRVTILLLKVLLSHFLFSSSNSTLLLAEGPWRKPFTSLSMCGLMPHVHPDHVGLCSKSFQNATVDWFRSYKWMFRSCFCPLSDNLIPCNSPMLRYPHQLYPVMANVLIFKTWSYHNRKYHDYLVGGGGHAVV